LGADGDRRRLHPDVGAVMMREEIIGLVLALGTMLAMLALVWVWT
jgi:hypothetical protein